MGQIHVSKNTRMVLLRSLILWVIKTSGFLFPFPFFFFLFHLQLLRGT